MIDVALKHLFPDIDFLPGRDCDLVDDGKGPYIAAWRRAERQPTTQELEAVLPVAQAALAAAEAARKAADDEQSAGIVEAKRAYARLQTIIDNADTATTVQLRAAIKEMARDIQHLIKAVVR